MLITLTRQPGIMVQLLSFCHSQIQRIANTHVLSCLITIASQEEKKTRPPLINIDLYLHNSSNIPKQR